MEMISCSKAGGDMLVNATKVAGVVEMAGWFDHFYSPKIIREKGSWWDNEEIVWHSCMQAEREDSESFYGQ